MARFSFVLSALSLASVALAQTYTSCNPMNTTCPSVPALGTNATFNFTGGAMGDSKIWEVTSGSIKWNEDGGDFVVAHKGDSPTIQSNFYMFFGVCSVFLRAAPGTGIVSSIVMQSDDLDEIDWELIGGNKTHVQSNYFGKGNTTSYDRAVWHPVDDPMDKAVNYTVSWTQEKLEWYVNNNLVRTLKYEDALDGYNYPQTPMNIRIGIWAGGDPDNNSNGTVEWAGGETDFSQAPFTMTVESIYAQDFTSGKEYTYGDKTGSYESIKVTEGTSAAEERITKPHGIKGRWEALSKVARIAIVASAIAVFCGFVLFILICCIRQRRIGRKEHALLQEEFQKAAAEREAHRRREFGFDG